MDFKWLMIFMCVAVFGITIGGSIDIWSSTKLTADCLARYADSNRTAEEIETICR